MSNVCLLQEIAVQTAQSGGSRRPRREDERPPAAVGSAYGSSEPEGYSNFSRSRERDGIRGSSYGDTWGGVKGGNKGQEGCYNCREVSVYFDWAFSAQLKIKIFNYFITFLT